MRGGQRTGGVGGRGRGRGDFRSRNRSPSPSNGGDHRSGSGYRNHPPLPHRPSRRSLSPLAERRGPRRSPIPPSSSIGQSHGERDYSVRRSEHGKHQPVSFDDQGINFQHKYMLPDHPTDLSDVHALLKSSRTIKDKDLAGSSSDIDSQGMLVQKSLFLDDGLKRTFYTLPQDLERPYDSAALVSSESMRSIGSSNSLNVGMPRYNQPPRDPYDNTEREKLYTRDVSFPVMLPPSRPFVSTSSSSFLEGPDLLRSFGDHGSLGKFLDDPLEYNGYNQIQLSDRMRRAPVSPPVRKDPLDYGYDELSEGGRVDHGYLPSDGPYRKMVYGHQGEFRDADESSFSDFAGGRVDRPDAYRKKFREGGLWDGHHSVHGDTAMKFHDLKGVHEDYVGSSGGGYLGFGPTASRDHELSPFEERYRFGRDAAPVAYRERPNSPLLVDHPLDAFRHGVSPPREKSREGVDFDIFDPSSNRMLRRNYVMNDDLDGRNLHRRLQSPSHGDEMWSNEEEYRSVEDSRQFLPPQRLAIGHSQYRPTSHKPSRNGGWGLSSGSSAHVEGDHGISLKKRLRPGPSERRQEFFRSHKVWKRGQEDRNGSLDASDGDVRADATRLMKKDPPEDSEEFKQQVHKAFLLFSKLLNETPHQQKRFRDDQAKSGKLLCCVCGSLFPKEFVDIHSLLTHSYHSHKVGLRTEHLGFHKALCVLNGWNWLVAPDTSKAYRRRPPSELKALKEDLILWPPIVIIHNSSIGNKSKSNGLKVVSVESLEAVLKEMGFGAGKTRVCRGKPANQSVLLVKFMPTLSGLQEAERLHKYYADNNRGRQGFHQIKSNSGEARMEKDEELLYGYMAIAEDLDKLDPETKKRSMVKSKKDIKAIADAPLKID